MKRVSVQAYLSRLAAGAAMIAYPASAWAQAPTAAQPDQAAQSSIGVEDIVVTAQRRSESVQKVPISIQVLTSEALARANVQDVRDISLIAPTVNFSNSAGAMVTSFGIRGIASVATAPGVQPSVGLVVDGAPVYNQGEFSAALGDVQRVEVLNGPQGTLFGKNSTAGLINVTTNDPTDEVEGLVEASATTDDETHLRGMVNLPLTEGMRLRVAGFYQNLEPQIDNLSGDDAYGLRAYGVRAKLGVDLAPNATFILAGTYTRNNSSQNQYIIVGPSILEGFATALGATIPSGFGGTTINSNAPAKDVYTTKNVKGTLEWEVSDYVTVTSITNYTDFRDRYQLDGDGTPFGANAPVGEIFPSSSYPFQSLVSGDQYRQHTRYISEELRANIKQGPIDAVIGGFYQNVKLDFWSFPPYRMAGFFSTLPGGAPQFSGGLINAYVKNNSAAVFADVNLSLTDQIKVFGGLRYTHETMDLYHHRNDYLAPYSIYDPTTGAVSAAPTRTVVIADDRTVDNLSGRAGIQYQPASNLNFYASFSRGYKGPAANNNSGLMPGQNAVLNPEIATAYEAGFKLRLLDNRLSLNGAAYHQTIKDLQVSSVDPNQAGVQTTLSNAGKIISKGFEGDVTVVPADGLQLRFAGAYTDATYRGFALPCTPAQTASNTCPNFNGVPGLQSADGFRATRAPKFRYTVGASYESDLVGTGLGFFSMVNYRHSSAAASNPDNNPVVRLPAYGSLDATIGIKELDDRWEVALFGKNILDKFYYSSLVTIAPIGQPVGYLPRDYHSYFGLKVTARFQ